MKYTLTARVVISVYTDVEADSLDEAIKIAEERDLMSVSQAGCGTKQDTWLCDELDGTVENISEA